jgi:RNA polymerase sigma-70 factor (ECF subfamily)
METGDTGAEEQKLERLEELLWVTEAQSGNSDAFVRLMNRYEKRLLYYLRRIVPEGDWALDLHQEVWIDAFRGLPSLQIPEAFRVWIYRIAHRKAARFIRTEKLHVETTRSLSENPSEKQEADVNQGWDAEAVHQALERLAPGDREVLTLHYLRDLSTQELAAVLDCPVGTVKSRLYHARIALRRIIEKKQL